MIEVPKSDRNIPFVITRHGWFFYTIFHQ
jgi:hypothetical protein